jgi:hypothetical protein
VKSSSTWKVTHEASLDVVLCRCTAEERSGRYLDVQGRLMYIFCVFWKQVV